MPNFCFCRFEMTTNEELEACTNRRISVESTDRNLFMPLSEAVLTLHRLPQIHSQYICRILLYRSFPQWDKKGTKYAQSFNYARK